MAPELNPNITAPAQAAQSHAAVAVCIETVVAIQSLRMLTRAYGLYIDALERHVETFDIDRKDKHFRRMRKRLRSIDALLILLGVYVHSDHVNDGERAAVSDAAASFDGLPTRNAIKATLRDEFQRDDTPEALRILASRIVDAAIFFDLVETTEDIRSNFKPLRGTEHLHRLVHDAGLAAALLVRDAMADRG